MIFFLLIVSLLSGILARDRIFSEKQGAVAVEAEHHVRQRADRLRSWHTRHVSDRPDLAGASGDTWLHLLPDTRITHDDPLIHGENFSGEPGSMAILDYRIHFENPGRYYVWVRAWSEGTEDNGLHVGIDGTWPESGARMQWCEGKGAWTWASRQRTERQHCGEERLIFLDVQEPGIHTISFSMREDGFQFDKFALSQIYEAPSGKGPDERLFKPEQRKP
jgi:hypothetical protein